MYMVAVKCYVVWFSVTTSFLSGQSCQCYDAIVFYCTAFLWKYPEIKSFLSLGYWKATHQSSVMHRRWEHSSINNTAIKIKMHNPLIRTHLWFKALLKEIKNSLISEWRSCPNCLSKFEQFSCGRTKVRYPESILMSTLK